jgi:hypothetical protein
MSDSGVDKKEISTVLQEVAVLLQLKGRNFLKVKAYFNAEKSVQILEEDPKEITRRGRLKDLKDMKGNRCHISPTHHGIGQHRKAQPLSVKEASLRADRGTQRRTNGL